MAAKPKSSIPALRSSDQALADRLTRHAKNFQGSYLSSDLETAALRLSHLEDENRTLINRLAATQSAIDGALDALSSV